MCRACDGLTFNAAARYDPTRTTTLRQAFEAEAKRRFARVAKAIREAVVAQNGFGLAINRAPFDFPRDADKAEAFLMFLSRLVEDNILEASQGVSLASAADRSWSTLYIRRAYGAGMSGAASRLRRSGAFVSPDWVAEAFHRPFHSDRVGLIYTRSYEALKGITDEMASGVSEALAQGLAEGAGSEALASRIVDRVQKIGLTRARMLARTESIRAYAEASLNTYQEANVIGVGVEAEFATARDNAVCPICAALAAEPPRSIEAARGVIPVHPNCRCAWIPRVINPRDARLA